MTNKTKILFACASIYTITVFIFGAMSYNFLASKYHNFSVNYNDMFGSVKSTSAVYTERVTEQEKAVSEIKGRPTFRDFIDSSALTVYLREQKELHEQASKAELDKMQSFSVKQGVEVTRASDMLNALLGDKAAQDHVDSINRVKNVK
jgi:hypothetical protein